MPDDFVRAASLVRAMPGNRAMPDNREGAVSMTSGQEQAGQVSGGPQQASPVSGGPQQATRAGQRPAGERISGPDYPDASRPGYPDGGSGREYPIESGSGAVTGFTVLAATLMIIGGLWSFFMGLSAIIKSQFYVVLPNYAFKINITTWGWIHLIIGALVFAAGVCLILGQLWARVVGVVLALISAVANFLFIPYYPVWSLIVIAIDVFIIWALMTGERREPA
jgi:hypothetical protein